MPEQMRGLTIKQPWAGCIAYLDKRVENRAWRCPGQHLGTVVAIHAAAAVDRAPMICAPQVILTVLQEEAAPVLAALRSAYDAGRQGR